MPECYFHGSVFVTFKAKDFMKDLLTDSTFIDDLDHITECFDKTTKPRFRNADDPQYIKFGGTRDNDPSCGIRFGQLKIAGSDVSKFFQPSIDCVVQAVMDQKQSARKDLSHIVLVGGFAASDWLFERTKTIMTEKGLVVIRPENHVNKAVSDGAISFYLDHYVRSRVAKVTYGYKASILYVDTDPEHAKRSGSVHTHADGLRYLHDGFRVVLPKNTQVSETKEFAQCNLTVTFTKTTAKSRVETQVVCYRGAEENPEWVDHDASNFTILCTLVADLSNVPLKPRRNSKGEVYYIVTFDIVMKFGLTELQAQLRWLEEGIERRSPARLIYDEV